jgi:beta-phosphoglucomutase-like phosphatase (HAD superfamily)
MNNIIKEYDLFIFELDNIILETEKYHYDAWIKTLKNNILTKNHIALR